MLINRRLAMNTSTTPPFFLVMSIISNISITIHDKVYESQTTAQTMNNTKIFIYLIFR